MTPSDIGQANAADVFTRRQAARATRAAALAVHPNPLSMRIELTSATTPITAVSRTTAGFLVAAGDSWFDYPVHDVLTALEDNYGYSVESAAHRGDAVEKMAYVNGQLDKLARCIDKIKAQGGVPKAVLLSGGGDDIAGPEFGMLLNNASSPIGGWNDEIVDGVVNVRIAQALRTMIASITAYCQQDLGKALPILVHGYGHPVPDGRGFLGGWPFPGPWLKPGFDEKLFSDLAANTQLMQTIIDRFNAMLAGIAQEPASAGNVHYIDVRSIFSSEPATYKNTWTNELHPTSSGFDAVATQFANVLSTLSTL